MPNMDGVEAQKKIKEINDSIPVIAVTAYAQSSDKNKLLKKKFDAYISKPFHSSTLLQLIEGYYKVQANEKN